MKLSLLVILFLTTSCTPELFKAAEDVLTDDAITVKVDKDAFQRDTDVKVNIEVINKEPRTTVEAKK